MHDAMYGNTYTVSEGKRKIKGKLRN